MLVKSYDNLHDLDGFSVADDAHTPFMQILFDVLIDMLSIIFSHIENILKSNSFNAVVCTCILLQSTYKVFTLNY